MACLLRTERVGIARSAPVGRGTLSMATPRDQTTEVRLYVRDADIEVLDAESMAEGISRTEYVLRLLSEHCRKRRHAATLLARITRGNPQEAE